jgi:hypothetical protein
LRGVAFRSGRARMPRDDAEILVAPPRHYN